MLLWQSLTRLAIAIRAGLLIGAALSWSAAAAAEPRHDPPAAEALFNEGREALERRDYATACAKFAESQRLEPAPGTLMNWATCLENQGKLASAWQRWKEAADALAPTDNRSAFARKRAAAAEARLPRLTIRLAPTTPAGTQVDRNGVRLGEPSFGTPLPVDPGGHVIRVVAPRHEPALIRISLAESERREIEVAPGKVSPKSKNAAQLGEQRKRNARLRTAGFSALGVGGAGVGVGIVTAVMLADRRNTVEQNCEDRECNRTGFDAAQSGRVMAAINASAWSIGAAGLSLGTVLLVANRARKEAPPTSALTFAPSRGGAQLRYQRRF